MTGVEYALLYSSLLLARQFTRFFLMIFESGHSSHLSSSYARESSILEVGLSACLKGDVAVLVAPDGAAPIIRPVESNGDVYPGTLTGDGT